MSAEIANAALRLAPMHGCIAGTRHEEWKYDTADTARMITSAIIQPDVEICLRLVGLRGCETKIRRMGARQGDAMHWPEHDRHLDSTTQARPLIRQPKAWTCIYDAARRRKIFLAPPRSALARKAERPTLNGQYSSVVSLADTSAEAASPWANYLAKAKLVQVASKVKDKKIHGRTQVYEDAMHASPKISGGGGVRDLFTMREYEVVSCTTLPAHTFACVLGGRH